jgi:hypothetical protein
VFVVVFVENWVLVANKYTLFNYHRAKTVGAAREQSHGHIFAAQI